MADIRRIVSLATLTNGIINPSGEADASNWQSVAGAGSASAAAQGSGARTGATGTKHVETTGTGVTVGTGIWLNAYLGATPVAPGQRVWGYGWGKGTTSASALDLRIQFYDYAFAFISQASVGLVTSPTTNQWYEFQGSAVAPTNAAYCSLTLFMTNSTTTPTLYADDFALVVDESFAGPYFDTVATVSTIIKTLEVDGSLMATRDSFAINPPQRTVSAAGTGRRYGGTYAVADSHANAEATWSILTKGNTADLCSQAVEAVIQPLENLSTPNTYLEWRPDGNTYSTFYEIRGPGTWKYNYSRMQYTSNNVVQLDVSIPVSPLGRGATTAATFGTSANPLTTPAALQVPGIVGGTAPAQVDLTVSHNNVAGKMFGAVGWWSRLPTPPPGYNNCYGLIQGEATTTLYVNNVAFPGLAGSWTSTGVVGANGGNALVTPAVTGQSGNNTAIYAVSTAGIKSATVDLEIWAQVFVSPTTLGTVTNPTITAWATGAGGGTKIYTREWGSAGRPLVQSTFAEQLTRVGTITLPVQRVSSQWYLSVNMSWSTVGGAGGGNMGLDTIMLLPADSRICSPTGEPGDSSYPTFLGGASAGYVTSKTVYSDLSSTIKYGGLPGADSGMGGSLIEFPPGYVDMGIIMSEWPPDGGDTGNYTSATIPCWLDFKITPRYFVVKGT